ncbi:MAG: hypothetical protein HYW65_02360 [Candidatus Liptonbacteria bacterium]|nr:hypothetical protein [Candidatus Liptonbacteria bacterium]
MKRARVLLLLALAASGNADAQTEPSNPSTPLTLRPIKQGVYYAGKTLDIAWERPASHVGKDISLTIILLPEGVQWDELSARTVTVAKDVRLETGEKTTKGGWRWKIPGGIYPGIYRVEVMETDGSVLFAPWDRSNDVVIIAPGPEIKFLGSQEPREIRAGSFPEFWFTLQVVGTATVQAYLTKDGEPLGQLLGSVALRNDTGNFTGFFRWELTRYWGMHGTQFAAPGEGYRILMGVLGEEGWHSITSFVDGFVSYDETAPFAITGTPPQSAIRKAEGVPALFIYIMGDPYEEYDVKYQRELGAPQWTQLGTIQIDEDGVWEGFLHQNGTTIGFLKAVKIPVSNR